MAVSDRRPFRWTLAEEETMVLYTAIPNRTISKSVAEKRGHVLTRTKNKGDAYGESIGPIDCPHLQMNTH